MIKPFLLSIIGMPVFIALILSLKTHPPEKDTFLQRKDVSPSDTEIAAEPLKISGIVRTNDTLESIFDRHNLSKSDMHAIYNTALNQYNLSKIHAGNVYTFEMDRTGRTLQGMQYGIDDLSFLSVQRIDEGFSAEKVALPVIRRPVSFSVQIEDNLVSSMPGTHREYLKIALALSDIYAWDIDFTHDIRRGDRLKILVEELWVGDVFRGYGDILAAEFTNNGKTHYAYRFEDEGYADYYDEKGNSLRKALLRSPLKFKYISSGYSRSRLHPILRKHRPHLGIDYAAPRGTPVSAAGNGKIVFSGYKGQMGKMVRIKHPGGYETYYGHLSKIPGNIRKGAKVSQGDLIGYVGATGLASGPHLDYRIKFNGKFVNPLKIDLPRGSPVPERMIARFRQHVVEREASLSTLADPLAWFRESQDDS